MVTGLLCKFTVVGGTIVGCAVVVGSTVVVGGGLVSTAVGVCAVWLW